MEYSMGLFVYYFGTKKIYEKVEHHTIKFGNKYKEHLDDIFVKKKLSVTFFILYQRFPILDAQDLSRGKETHVGTVHKAITCQTQ